MSGAIAGAFHGYEKVPREGLLLLKTAKGETKFIDQLDDKAEEIANRIASRLIESK